MKRIALLFAVLALGCSSEKVDVAGKPDATEAVAAVFNAEGAPTVAFSVPDMMCEDSCVPTVKKTLADQPGVKDVKVELATKTATVAVDEDEFDADKAVASLVDLQFTETKLIDDDAAIDSDDATEPAASESEDAPADEKAADTKETVKS